MGVEEASPLFLREIITEVLRYLRELKNEDWRGLSSNWKQRLAYGQ